MSFPTTNFSNSPHAYPHSWDTLNDALYVISLTEAQYSGASFLDQRVITPSTVGNWRSWRESLDAAASVSPAKGCHFIFHIGHVGSTLLSRLLGNHSEVFSLREPTPLRTLAQLYEELGTPESLMSPEGFAERVSVLVKLWGRTWAKDQVSIVKASSLTCGLAAPLLANPQGPKALLMFVPPRNFLATILVAPNSPQDIRAMAQGRLRRLHRLIGRPAWRLWQMSLGEMTAMSWACEMTALRAAAKRFGKSVQWIEFDRFLADPREGLARSFVHLGIDVKPDAIDRTVNGPLMRQYSKAPEHAYDAALRRNILQEGLALHGEDVRRGLHWLRAAGDAFPVIAEALDFARA